MGFRLKLFLEKFSIRAAVLNDEIPQNSRLHVCEEFNAGLFDYLIATDDGKIYTKEQEVAGNDDAEMKESKKQWNQNLDAESGVVRDIDFKNVHTVINVQMPSTAAGYIHRIGRTGRACNTGSSVCLVSQEEMEAFEELKSTLAEHTSGVDLIAPFPLPLGNAVELLRYRTEASTLVKCSSSQSKRVREEIDDGGESAAILKSVKQYWFAIKAAVLNPDLTQTMRVHTVSDIYIILDAQDENLIHEHQFVLSRPMRWKLLKK